MSAIDQASAVLIPAASALVQGTPFY